MLGVKSTHEPITGVFAEQFCKQLLQSTHKHKKVETKYEIVREG